MNRFAQWVATAVFLVAAVTGFASQGSAAARETVTGTGAIQLSHFHEDGTRAVHRINDNWWWVQAPQDLSLYPGILSFANMDAIGGSFINFVSADGERRRDLRDKAERTLSTSIFVARTPWPMQACGYTGSFDVMPNLEFIIEGETDSVETEPMSGTIRSTSNSDIQFKGTWVAGSLGFGLGTLLNYTVTITCP